MIAKSMLLCMFVSPALHAAADDALSKAITVVDATLKDGLRSTHDSVKKSSMSLCYGAMASSGLAALHKDEEVKTLADLWHQQISSSEDMPTAEDGLSLTVYNITYDKELTQLIKSSIPVSNFSVGVTHGGFVIARNIRDNAALQLSDKQVLQFKAAHLCLVYKLKELCTRNSSLFDAQFADELAPSVSTESASQEAASGWCLLQ